MVSGLWAVSNNVEPALVDVVWSLWLVVLLAG